MSNPEVQKGRLNAIMSMEDLPMQISVLESIFVESPWCVEGNMQGRFAMVAEGDIVTDQKNDCKFIFDRATNMRVDLSNDPIFSLTMLHAVGPQIKPSNTPGIWAFTLRTGESFEAPLGRGLMIAILLNGIEKIPSGQPKSEEIEQQLANVGMLVGTPPANDMPC